MLKCTSFPQRYVQISANKVYQNGPCHPTPSMQDIKGEMAHLREKENMDFVKSAPLPLVLSSCLLLFHFFFFLVESKWPVQGFSSLRNACGSGNRMSGAAPAADSGFSSLLQTAAPAPVSYNSLHTTCEFHFHAMFLLLLSFVLLFYSVYYYFSLLGLAFQTHLKPQQQAWSRLCQLHKCFLT